MWITGFGEHIAFKTPTYAEDLLRTPIARAADRAFAMAGLTRSDVDVASIYDCYTITVLMTLEDAGFCDKGRGCRGSPAATSPAAATFPSTQPVGNCRSVRPAWPAACTTSSTVPGRSWAGPATRRYATATPRSSPATAAS